MSKAINFYSSLKDVLQCIAVKINIKLSLKGITKVNFGDLEQVLLHLSSLQVETIRLLGVGISILKNK